MGLGFDSLQLYIDFSDEGLEFSPFDPLALVFETTTNTILACANTCNTMAQCRTMNYNPDTAECRLYKGDMDSTGLVVPSTSPRSTCASVILAAEDFLAYGQACSYCQDSRYLRCLNFTCQCQLHHYFDGRICRSQKFNGSACTDDIQCRNDMGLICLSYIQCGC